MPYPYYFFKDLSWVPILILLCDCSVHTYWSRIMRTAPLSAETVWWWWWIIRRNIYVSPHSTGEGSAWKGNNLSAIFHDGCGRYENIALSSCQPHTAPDTTQIRPRQYHQPGEIFMGDNQFDSSFSLIHDTLVPQSIVINDKDKFCLLYINFIKYNEHYYEQKMTQEMPLCCCVERYQ